jgi:hypothetical protein
MLEVLGGKITNDGADDIATEQPYRVSVEITGSADMLFHMWSNEAVAEKSKAKKNSAAKKTDNVESYIYRLNNKNLGLPGDQLRGSIVNAAKYRQDPRSPRKSAMDLYKAGIVVLTHYADLNVPTWDYLDRRRVVVQRAAITRTRPAMLAGWKATFEVLVLLPEYIGPDDLRLVIENAGKLCGIGDHRPTFGRFGITKFEILSDENESKTVKTRKKVA